MSTETTQTAARLLTAREVAEILSISTGRLAAWRQQGNGPAYVKLGKERSSKVRYRLSEIESFLVDCGRRSTSDQGVQ